MTDSFSILQCFQFSLFHVFFSNFPSGGPSQFPSVSLLCFIRIQIALAWNSLFLLFFVVSTGIFVFFYNNFTQLFNVFVAFSDFLESSRVSSLTAFLGVSRFKELMQYLDDYMQRYEDENGGWTT